MVAGLILIVALRLRHAALPSLRQWRDAAVVGVLLLTVGNGAVVLAERSVSSSVAAMFIGCAPLLAALWSGLFGAWPPRRQWLGIGLGLFGVLILCSGNQLAGDPFALMELLAAVMCWTFGSVLAQRRLRLAPGVMGFASEMLVGGVVLMACSLITHEVWPTTIPLHAFWAWLYLTIAGSLIAFSAYMYLLSKVSSAIASSYGFVNPVIALGLGVWLAHEHLSGHELVGCSIIVMSVVLLALARRQQPRGR